MQYLTNAKKCWKTKYVEFISIYIPFLQGLVKTGKLELITATFFKISHYYFCQEINSRINYFVFIIILIFLFSRNLLADFYKFFNCRLFNSNSRKSFDNKIFN